MTESQKQNHDLSNIWEGIQMALCIEKGENREISVH